MLVLNHKQVKSFLLASICICGLSAGYFAAQLTGYLLQPPADAGTASRSAERDNIATTKAVDTATILQKNIFDPNSRGQSPEPAVRATREPVATSTRSNLKLFGTVDGGDNPLALIQSGGKVRIFRIGDDIPGGGELISVSRNEAIIGNTDGSQSKLTIVKPTITSSTPAPGASTGTGIRNLGDNRWSVARSEVEKARTNLNQLLKSARMEPNIVNGQTEGFVVKMIRPKSLLAQLGIRRGDTVTRVNGVELNSPEKALQIFQQLREAKRLTVDLKRGNENLTFDYEVN